MYLNEETQKKWKKVLDNESLPKISDPYRRAVTIQLLENQQRDMSEQNRLLNEAAPTNSANFGATGTIGLYDPILIALVRRAMPNLIAFDVCGVQPMTGPTGLIFAMKSRYTSPSYTSGSTSAQGAEALFNEAETQFSGYGTQYGTSPARTAGVTSNYYAPASATSTVSGESAAFAQMALSIDKVTVTAKTRQLKAEYSIELQQDLKAVHGLDAEAELSNILSTEILAEINREVIRTIYNNATAGAETDTTTAGIFDLDVDSNGRWSVERFKGLMYQIERDANSIAVSTRRGRGNVIITSSDVASALSIAGLLDCGSALKDNLTVDATGNTFAGILNGRFKVYVDPYAPVTGNSNNSQYYCVGYKGASPFDAGMFYCPYVPLQMVRAVDPDTFQPKIGFKTRYGLVANPFAIADASSQSSTYGALTFNTNKYYRLTTVNHLM